MNESFSEMFAVGGKSNSLGRTNEVINQVLHNRSCLEELYLCLFNEDAWIRMRAADALEKVCRQQPGWLLSYIDRFISNLHISSQPSIQWHLAQIYTQVDLTDQQRQLVIEWLTQLISSKDTDWIVAANTMDTLAHFTKTGYFSAEKLVKLLCIQQQHASNAVIKRADKYLAEFSA